MRNLHIRLRQWVLLASVVTALVTFAIVVAFFSQDKSQTRSPTPSTTIHLQNDSFNEEHFVTTYGAKVTALEKEMAALSAQMKREEERKKREKQYAFKKSNSTLLLMLWRANKWALSPLKRLVTIFRFPAIIEVVRTMCLVLSLKK